MAKYYSRSSFNEHAELNLILDQRISSAKCADFLLVLGVPAHFTMSFAKSRSDCAKSGDLTDKDADFENHPLFLTNGSHRGQDGGRQEATTEINSIFHSKQK